MARDECWSHGRHQVDRDHDPDCDHNLDRDHDPDHNCDHDLDHDPDPEPDPDPDRDHDPDHDCDHDLDHDLDPDRDPDLDPDRDHSVGPPRAGGSDGHARSSPWRTASDSTGWPGMSAGRITEPRAGAGRAIRRSPCTRAGR